MLVKDLVKMICKKEGLKKEVSIGNVREIVGIVSDAVFADSEAVAALVKNGKQRAKRKK